jgi:hypothetical protein
MKQCPQCKRTYADKTIAFCLADGALLSAPYDPDAAPHISPPPPANFPPTEVLLPNQSSGSGRHNKSLLYIIVSLTLIAAGAAFVLLRSGVKNEGSQSELPATTTRPPSPISSPKIEQANVKEEVKTDQNQSENSKPDISGQPSVPKIYGSSYDDARKILIKEGWIPNKNPMTHGDTVEVQSGNGPIFWNRGYWELVSCSGTGLAHCRFEFSEPGQRVLVVVTEGEEDEDGKYHATVSRVFFNDK